MADVSNLLSDFNKQNIIAWAKDIGLFFRSPRTYVSALSAKPEDELLPQIAFYFLVYTFSYVFFSTASDFATLIKPAIVNITLSIPIIAVFSLSSYISTKSSYLKKTLIFILSINFFSGPLLMLIFVIFLNTENYLYLLIGNMLLGLQALLATFFYGYVIEQDHRRARWITFINYVFINLIYVISLALDFDRDASGQIEVNDDKIINEYREIVEPLKEKSRVPTARFIYTFSDKVVSEVVIGDMITDHNFTGSTDSNKIFRHNVSVNLNALNSNLKNIKFRRNRNAILNWIKYYNAVAQEFDFKYEDTAQVFHDSRLHLLKNDTVTHLRLYSTGVKIDSMVATQMLLKSYHNNLINVASIAGYPNVISDYIMFLPGKFIEAVHFYIFVDGVKHSYKEQFDLFE